MNSGAEHSPPKGASAKSTEVLANAVRTPLWLGVTMLFLGNGLLGTLLGVRAGIEGFATVTIGLIMSAYYVGYLAGSRVGPKFIHRVGHIRTFAALAAVASAAVSLHAVVVTPLAWIMLRVLSGLCFAGLFIVLESWINASATNQNRGHLLSIYMIVTLGGLAAGQQLLNLVDPAGFQLFILCSLLISLSLVPFALTDRTAPRVPKSGGLGMGAVLGIAPLGIIGCFAVGASNGAFWGMAPNFAHNIGLSVAQIGIFMTSVILGGMVGQWPIGLLSDAMDRRWVIAMACIICAILSSAIVWWSRQSELLLFSLGFMFGGFTLTLYSLCVAHTNDLMEGSDLVETSSALLGAFGLGAIFGPFAASMTMTAMGPQGLFLYIAIVSTCLGVFAVQRIVVRKPVSPHKKEKFVAVPQTTSAVHELDPRVDTTEG